MRAGAEGHSSHRNCRWWVGEAGDSGHLRHHRWAGEVDFHWWAEVGEYSGHQSYHRSRAGVEDDSEYLSCQYWWAGAEVDSAHWSCHCWVEVGGSGRLSCCYRRAGPEPSLVTSSPSVAE